MSEQQEKSNVIWISDGPDYPSGFATVGRNVTFRLAGLGHRINYIHVQKAGLSIPFYGAMFEDLIQVVPQSKIYILPGSGEKPFGESTFITHYDNLRRHKLGVTAVVTQMDLHMTQYIYKHHRDEGFNWIHYLPIDGEPLPPSWRKILREMDTVICMSKYGAQKLKEFNGMRSKVIYHGVNTELFKPIKSHRPPEWEGKFVIGAICRNQHRKRLPELLEVYKRFRKGRESKVFLYLHMSPIDKMGWLFPEIIEQIGGIKGGVGWASNFDPNVARPISDVVDIYNACDVTISTTGGEGFGLPTIESMACERPVIITDYTTSREIVGFGEKDAGGLHIRVDRLYRPSDRIGSVKRALIDPKHGAEQLQYLFENPTEVVKLGKQGRERCKRLFSWDKIARQWQKTILG